MAPSDNCTHESCICRKNDVQMCVGVIVASYANHVLYSSGEPLNIITRVVIPGLGLLHGYGDSWLKS